jgi:hypothetical protein
MRLEILLVCAALTPVACGGGDSEPAPTTAPPAGASDPRAQQVAAALAACLERSGISTTRTADTLTTADKREFEVFASPAQALVARDEARKERDRTTRARGRVVFGVKGTTADERRTFRTCVDEAELAGR